MTDIYIYIYIYIYNKANEIAHKNVKKAKKNKIISSGSI